MSEQPSASSSSHEQPASCSQRPHHEALRRCRMMLAEAVPTSDGGTSSHASTPPDPSVASIANHKWRACDTLLNDDF